MKTKVYGKKRLGGGLASSHAFQALTISSPVGQVDEERVVLKETSSNVVKKDKLKNSEVRKKEVVVVSSKSITLENEKLPSEQAEQSITTPRRSPRKLPRKELLAPPPITIKKDHRTVKNNSGRRLNPDVRTQRLPKDNQEADKLTAILQDLTLHESVGAPEPRRSPRRRALQPPKLQDYTLHYHKPPQHIRWPCSDKPIITDSTTASLSPALLNYLRPLLSLPSVSPTAEPFSSWLTARLTHLTIQKIGEGSFGEVYRAATISRPFSTAILKIIPLRPHAGPGSKSKHTLIASAATEIRLLDYMQSVPGFVAYRGACVLQGKMPDALCREWQRYRDGGRSVGSEDPRKKGAYNDGSLWLVVEMDDAGGGLERGYEPPSAKSRTIEEQLGGLRLSQEPTAAVKKKFKHKRTTDKEAERPPPTTLSVKRTWSIFWHVVRAVAKAEVYAEFEHRDLHDSNICVRDTRAWKEDDDSEDWTLVPANNDPAGSDGILFGLERTGVEVTIIDYSLSRAAIRPDSNNSLGNGISADVEEEEAEEEVLSYDLHTDPGLVEGQGDLQYDIYRYMVDAVGPDSAAYTPRTNVLWLWCLLVKLMARTERLSTEAEGKRVVGEEDRRVWVTRAEKMRSVMEGLERALEPAEYKGRRGDGDGPLWRCAGDLIEEALEQGWFGEEDVL
jgi:serine/threonine protein kinase